MRKRLLLIGRHDYWPSYTPDVVKSLDYDFWPHLALACDSLVEQRQKDQQELEQMRSKRRR